MKQLMESLKVTLQQQLGLDPVTTVRLFLSLLVILLLLGSKKLFDMYADRRIEDVNKRHMATKTVHYLSGLISFIIIGVIWFGGSTGLAAYLGILSAGLAIALQDPLVNIAGWMFIVVRTPFEVGDRIEIVAETRRGGLRPVTVVPYGVDKVRGAPRLVAFDVERGVTRIFRLDRVVTVGSPRDPGD